VRGFLQRLLVAAALTSIAWAQAERVVLTQDDLVRMADTGLPVSLIVKVIESADEVPVLQPQDITDLAAKGVPVEALEAIVARKGRTAPSAPAAAAATPAGRRVNITATLDQRRGLLGGFQKSDAEAFAVYWGAAALNAEGTVLPIESCPKQPACWCVSATGEKTCAAENEPAWRQRFSCFQAAEMTPGEAMPVFSLDAPQGTAELRVYPFYMVQEKGGAVRLASWDSAGASAYVSVEPRGSESYSAEAGLSLIVSRNAKTDLTMPVKRFNADGERPGIGGRITLQTLNLTTTPLPQSCEAQ
jgi:hypothetical protein